MKPLTISPYRRSGVWVFDDSRTGLKEEAFVSGADTMIDRPVLRRLAVPGTLPLLFSALGVPQV